MVELLVVISIIAILATAVLAALNPMEQLRKGRDTARKADAQAIVGAIDRFQSTFGCYPWEYSPTNLDCSRGVMTQMQPGGVGASLTVPRMTNNNYLSQLFLKEELKDVFISRTSIQNHELWISEGADNGQASVCFTPESKSARGGGLGPIRNRRNGTSGPAPDCSGAYVVNDADCAVCVPQ